MAQISKDRGNIQTKNAPIGSTKQTPSPRHPGNCQSVAAPSLPIVKISDDSDDVCKMAPAAAAISSTLSVVKERHVAPFQEMAIFRFDHLSTGHQIDDMQEPSQFWTSDR